MGKIILHIDLNAFFVRCEELKNPDLIGKPVAIGHLGRGGIVSTCSYKAREYGVRSGMPTFEARQRCPHLILIDGNYRLYEEKSKEFFRYIRNFSKLVEPASIDECYVDATEYLNQSSNPIAAITKIQDGLLKETGLMCSIGVSTNKFLAKMASDMKKPMGITIIHKRDIAKILYPLPIEAFYGIGKKTTPKLRALNINTIGDLAKRLLNEDDELRSLFGKYYYALKDLISGKGSDEIIVESDDPKSIGHSKTLDYDVLTIEGLLPHLEELTKRVVNQAKRQNFLGGTVQINLKDTSFKTITRSKKLEQYTNDYNEIFNLASSLLEKNYRGESIRLIGITLQNLVSKSDSIIQLSIFDDYEAIEEEYRTKLLIAELNRKLKKPMLKTLADMMREQKDGYK